jgi:antitoxin component YwqK of YwqJK toxin-antitoxin module
MKEYKMLFLLLIVSCNSTKSIKSEFWDNGKIKSEIEYIDGAKTGKAIFWHENGIKEKEQYFRNGKVVKEQRIWSNSGIIQEESLNIEVDTFVIFEPQNNWDVTTVSLKYDNKIYYKNGQLKESGYILYGKKDGTWNNWDSLGNLIKVIEYKEDSLVSERIFDFRN